MTSSNFKIQFLFILFLFGVLSLSAQNVGVGTDTPQGEFHVTKPSPDVEINFIGTGLNDLNVNKDGFDGEETIDYFVRVTNVGPVPNLYQWSNDGATWSSNQAMWSGTVILNHGVGISFGLPYGHSFGDEWQFSVSPEYPDGLIVKNGKVGIGTINPVSKLDVNGKLNLGNDGNDPVAGDVRFSKANDFQGYDGESWYSLTGRKDVYNTGDTSNLNSYNMIFDFSNNPLFVSDSVAVIYDNGGPDGPLTDGPTNQGLTILNNGPNPASKIKIKVENGDESIFLKFGCCYGSGGNKMILEADETKTFVFDFDLSEKSIYTVNDIPYEGFKITYTLLYLDSISSIIPQETFPLSYVIQKKAMIGGEYNYTITEDSIGQSSFQWGIDAKAKGDAAIAFGSKTKATGYYSTALGRNSNATGTGSTALGYYTNSVGAYSTALGSFTHALGNNSTSMGKETEAIGDYSTAIGNNTIATGERSISIGNYASADTVYAIAIGRAARAKGASSIAIGNWATAIGTYSTAMGRFTEAIGESSISMGYYTEAIGDKSTAMGQQTKSSGENSLAAGILTGASGKNSVAMGELSYANGDNSFVFGSSSVASASHSVAMGLGTKSNSQFSTVLGIQNVGLTNSLFEVGNGTFDNTNGWIKRNAFTVLSNGFIGTKDMTAPLANLHLGYINEGWNSHIRLEYDSDEYTALVSDFDGFKIRTFGAGSHFYVRNNNNDTNVLFYEDGNAWLRGTLTQNSDKRLKKSITPLVSSLASLQVLNGYNYYWKDKSRDQQLQSGVIAQELKEVLPHLVQEDEKGFLSVNYIGLIPHLIEASKELKEENDELKAKQKLLEEMYSELNDRLNSLEE